MSRFSTVNRPKVTAPYSLYYRTGLVRLMLLYCCFIQCICCDMVLMYSSQV